MLPLIAAGNLGFEAGDLICECPPADVDGPIPIRIHAA
jgi:hypothetical protein